MNLLDAGNLVLGAGWIVALVGAVYVGRSRGKDELIDTLQETAGVLRQDLVDAEARWGRKLEEQERRCSAEVSELRGTVQTLTPVFARVLAVELAPAVVSAVVSARKEGDL